MSEQEKPTPLKGMMIPKDVEDKVRRAREAMYKDKDLRRVCVKFWQNEPYWYVKSRGGIGVLPTALDAVNRQDHRIRNTYNYIHSVVEGKVSAASQKVPGYEIDPSSSDPEDIAEARIAQQVAFWGHDKWRLRRHKAKVITNALVQREGFLYPYFDPNVGPYKQNPMTGKFEGQGEIRHLNLSRSEVGWEPGVDFDDSPYYIIERAVLREQVERIPGFVGGTLARDARTKDTPEGKTSDQMVVLTEVLERPCPDYPDGRRIFIANQQVVVDARKADELAEYWWEPYPYIDADDEVIDEPCLHRLSYIVDPEGDDRGLVELLIDLQRTILDCWNKILEVKNRALMLQMIAPRGSRMPRRDDTPGAINEYNLVGGQKPEWEPAPDPSYITQLSNVLEMAIMHMRAIAADLDTPQDLTDVSSKSLNAAVEQAKSRWQSFLGDVAEFDSRLMRHDLVLAARHYDQERIMTLRGTHGWEPAKAFSGKDLPSQANIRVLPGSIESKSRASVMEEISFIVTTWGPEALSPEMAASAIHAGTPEVLFKTYDLHKARAWDLVMKIREDFDSLLQMPMRQDVEMGDVANGFMVPDWMPRKQDNLVIWKQVISDYMIEPDFQTLEAEQKAMFDEVWAGLEALEQRRMMMLAVQQQDTAATLGAANAARPQGAIPSPSPQGLSREQAGPAAGTPSG